MLAKILQRKPGRNARLGTVTATMPPSKDEESTNGHKANFFFVKIAVFFKISFQLKDNYKYLFFLIKTY